MFELSTLADRIADWCDVSLISWNVTSGQLPRAWCQRSVNSRWLTIYVMHVYIMNFRKHELFDTQNLLFPIVFSILHKTLNATYIILFCMFRSTIFHFIIVFLIQLLAATANKYILCYVYIFQVSVTMMFMGNKTCVCKIILSYGPCCKRDVCMYVCMYVCIRDLRSFEIRFDSIRKWLADSKSAAPAVVPSQTTLTVQQKNFNRCAVVTCNWDLFHVYEYMIRPFHYIRSLH